jgi:hypothetical protein
MTKKQMAWAEEQQQQQQQQGQQGQQGQQRQHRKASAGGGKQQAGGSGRRK